MFLYQLINFDNAPQEIVNKIRRECRESLAQGYRWLEWDKSINTIYPSPDLSLVYARDLGCRELLLKVSKANSLNIILLGGNSGVLAFPCFEGDFDIRVLNTYMCNQMQLALSPRRNHSQFRWMETEPLPLSSIKSLITPRAD